MTTGSGFWSTFKLDRWYKLVAGLSGIVLIAGLTVPMQVPNRYVITMAIGGLCIGLGEWINNPKAFEHRRMGNLLLSTEGTVRINNLGGLLLDLAGLVMLVYSVVKLLR